MDDLKLALIKDGPGLKNIEEKWDLLWLRAEKAAFHQTYSFCSKSWENLSKSGKGSLFCIAIFENETLMFLWPLVISKKGIFKVLKPLGPDAAEASNVLADQSLNLESIKERVWQEIQKSHCDFMSFSFVKSNNMLAFLLPKEGICAHDAAPYATFPNDITWEAFCKQIGTNSQHQLNRKRKRLNEMGNFEFRDIDPTQNPEETAKLITWMMQHKQVWADRHGKKGSWLFSKSYQEFLVKLITDKRNERKFIIYAIMVNEEPIAIKVAALGKNHIELIIAAYHADKQFSRYSPGFVLDEHWIEIAFNKHLDVDFGTGTEAYKMFWSRDNVHAGASYKVPITAIGKIAVTALQMVKNLRAIHKKQA